MPDILGNLIVIAVLAAIVVFAVRSLWKSHKTGGHCSGNCASCGGCPGSRHTKQSVPRRERR